MVDWANVRWWVAFVTSNIFGGLSPAKDWVKHLVPVLWPKDKAKANLEPVAERSAQTISRLEGLEPLLTNVSDLCSSLEAQGTRAKEQVSLLDKREIHLNEREALAADRENRVTARGAASTLEEERNLLVLNDFLSDIEGILRGS
ncbi:hypothetical protein BDV32DRAFT_146915 [Aspergillus pseudonomiae]|nr:hypothetical protein BDV32DRAFT_146915 [Aspergillus pseudonomiae]